MMKMIIIIFQEQNDSKQEIFLKHFCCIFKYFHNRKTFKHAMLAFIEFSHKCHNFIVYKEKIFAHIKSIRQIFLKMPLQISWNMKAFWILKCQFCWVRMFSVQTVNADTNTDMTNDKQTFKMFLTKWHHIMAASSSKMQRWKEYETTGRSFKLPKILATFQNSQWKTNNEELSKGFFFIFFKRKPLKHIWKRLCFIHNVEHTLKNV